MIQEFKEFINRGNIVEMAVAFVMGVTFAAVISTFTERLINPLVAVLIPGLSRLEQLGTFADGNGSIGAVIGAIINFVIVAFILFLVVKAYNAMRRHEEAAEPPPGPSEEVILLAEIRDSLRR